MEKRCRGRPPKVSLPLSNQHPDFFEIFLPDHISHQLRIPTDFVKNFEQKIPETVVVKDLQGKVWHVDLKQDKNGVFLTNGWNGFVKDKCLILGDFMLFRYHKNSAVFSVRIFGKNACKKDEQADQFFGYVKEEQESDQKSTPICKREPETFADSREVTLRRTPREVTLRRTPREVTLRRTPREAPLRRTPRSVSKRVKRNKGFKAQTICFTICISKTKKTQLHIPKRVLNAYNVHFGPNEEMSMYNKKGKSWPVKILRTSDHRILISRGWWKFRIENNIELYDNVQFTLVLGHSRVCTEIHAKSV